MIMSGFTIKARRAGTKLAMATAPVRAHLLTELLRHAAQRSQPGENFGKFDAQAITAFCQGLAVHSFSQENRIADLNFNGRAGWNGFGRDKPYSAAGGVLDRSRQTFLWLAENGNVDKLFNRDAIFTPLFHRNLSVGIGKTT